ncbi:MAG: zinc ABC transporter substrate-binding protein [Acidobacteriota bacterium]|nr:zinc ABC transporter substrate-binding protein [Acidobacteriota bacterium]MDE3139677.1 zinc ABC transporter substrate-binding protein [Acidobacteriota bacterium]
MILKKRGPFRGVSLVVALTMGTMGLAGCAPSHTATGVIDVVGAEVQYGDVLSQIGGAYVHVTSIMTNPNTDPHNFGATPSVARTISTARLIVQNGAGYDSFMNQLEGASTSPSRVVISVASLRHQSTAANPHFWYDPTTMPLVASTVAQDLTKIAPAHAPYFHAREATFAREWRAVTVALATARGRFAGRQVATTEPVGDYLLSAMGLTIATPFRFQADVMNGIDPSPQDIVTQQRLLSRRVVAALCYNAQVTSPVTQSLVNLAVASHVALVAIYETMPQGLHVQSWMLAEITAVSDALAHGTSTRSIS